MRIDGFSRKSPLRAGVEGIDLRELVVRALKLYLQTKPQTPPTYADAFSYLKTIYPPPKPKKAGRRR